MGEFLSAVEADIPEPTCSSIDAVLRDIAEPRRLADKYACNLDRVDDHELREFPSLVDTALWGMPDELEKLRNDNAQLRDGVHHLGSYCHEAGALLLKLASAIEADVLRVVDSCGGARGPESQEWSDGYNAALQAVERELKRFFARSSS